MARYPTYRRPRSGRKRLFVLVVLIAAAGAGTWALYAKNTKNAKNGDAAHGDDASGRQGAGDGGTSRNATKREADAPRPETMRLRKLAMQDYERGMKLEAHKDIIKARAALSKAVLSGHLARDAEARAVRLLTTIADMTILSPRIYEGDSYAMAYTFQRGDFLSRVERKLKLYVSWQGLLRINNLQSDRRIRASQVLKMIKGPFHAIVYKSRHIMDIYLHRNGMEKVFVRRIPVGLGRQGVTPVGSWKVITRLDHADYYPTANSPVSSRRRIRYGEKDYAFGKKGLWIGLAGTDAATAGKTGYGLHSTTDQSSIGKDASEGCIRLSDEDSQLVFDLFYEQRPGDRNEAGIVRWSTVQVRP